MKQLFPRGKRIRPTDKDLVFHTALASLLPVFLLVAPYPCRNHLGEISGTALKLGEKAGKRLVL